jgi:DNA-binding transcriptional MocR family regulator
MGETQTRSRVPLSLAHGKVPADPSIVDGFRQMLDLVLEREGARAFDPGPPEGLPSLRAAIAAYLGSQRVPVRAQDILITAGARQALHIIASVLVNPGDVVIVEGPTYRGAIQTFQGLGARLLCVPVDHDGMDVEVLEGMLAHVRPALIYTVPTFQNPSGASLSIERRQCLLEAAARSQVPIVEDDPYWELRYDGQPVPRLKALDDWGGVIHLGTFSKLIFPGVRVGWIAAPIKVVEQAAVAKTGLGLHVSSLSQWSMARLLEEGMLEPHIRRACIRLRSKRELFLDALARSTHGRLAARRPEGGFFIWARLNAPFQAVDLLKEAVARGVDFVAGPSFWPNGGDPNALRLCFAGLDGRGLVLAAKHLGDSVTAAASAMDAGSAGSCLPVGRLRPGVRSAARP